MKLSSIPGFVPVRFPSYFSSLFSGTTKKTNTCKNTRVKSRWNSYQLPWYWFISKPCIGNLPASASVMNRDWDHPRTGTWDSCWLYIYIYPYRIHETGIFDKHIDPMKKNHVMKV